MTWKNTLRKMPMPMNVATNRDAEYKQKIIQFEKEKIEPVFTQYVQSLRAESNPELRIVVGGGFGRTRLDDSTFIISADDAEKLGNNGELIISTIAELYKGEGYEVQVDGTVMRFHMPANK